MDESPGLPSVAAPSVVFETSSLLVVAKPSGMHCAPLRSGEGGTLVQWCAEIAPAILNVSGAPELEGGLLHRLDSDTAGLVLFAKSGEAYRALKDDQTAGRIKKEYWALCSVASPRDRPGYPPAPGFASQLIPGNASGGVEGHTEAFVVESGFRAWGPGRKEVRPVAPGSSPRYAKVALDRGRPYRTLVVEAIPLGGVDQERSRNRFVRAEILRGFRHQVRCHLSWLGLPIWADPLYGMSAPGPMRFVAVALELRDPDTGHPIRVTLERGRELPG